MLPPRHSPSTHRSVPRLPLTLHETRFSLDSYLCLSSSNPFSRCFLPAARRLHSRPTLPVVLQLTLLLWPTASPPPPGGLHYGRTPTCDLPPTSFPPYDFHCLHYNSPAPPLPLLDPSNPICPTAASPRLAHSCLSASRRLYTDLLLTHTFDLPRDSDWLRDSPCHPPLFRCCLPSAAPPTASSLTPGASSVARLQLLIHPLTRIALEKSLFLTFPLTFSS